MMLKNLIIFLIFLLFQTKSFAAPRCENLFDNIYNDINRQDVNIQTIENEKNIGIQLETIWEEFTEINDPRFPKFLGRYILKTNKDGYYSVGKVTHRGLAKQIRAGDVIISINGIDLRELVEKINKLQKENEANDEIKLGQTIIKKPIIKLIEDNISDLFEVGDKIYFELLRENKDKNKKEKIQVQHYYPDFKYTDQWEKIENVLSSYDQPDMDIYITAINIDEKNGTFDASIDTNFTERIDDRYFLTKAIWNDIVYNKEFKSEKLNSYMYETCTFPDDRYQKLNTVDPIYGIKFENVVQEYKHLRKSHYFLSPVIEHWVSGLGNVPNLLQNKAIINHKSSSVYKIRNDFNLKSFPFDKQKLTIYLRAHLGHKDISSYRSKVSHKTIKRALEFKDANSIQGWNIKNIKSNYSLYEDSIDLKFYDGFKLELEIERKSGYYISKIILPIILILIICWSAIWIDPKEIESRLTITIVCLLSLIAYNFVIDSQLPKLEYLTIMDYIILVSYIYAAIPSILSIYSFQLFKKNKLLVNKYEILEKRYGILSYVLIIFSIILINSSSAPENTNSLFSWAIMY
tara:strand:- start:252 stop:1976 length:1725 start_codon:yes stop_codon:yes gene_type:complete